MTLINAAVATGNDDGQENVTTGAMFLTGLAIRPGSDTVLYGAFRIQLDIPQGATIDDAVMEIYFPNSGQDNVGVDIQAEDIDDAPALTTTAFNISSRTLTTASVDWTDTNAAPSGAGLYETPDISSVIQEIVNRASWEADNYIMIVMTGKSGYPNFWSYDRGSSNAPNLKINYTAAVASGTTTAKRTITIPHMTTVSAGRF